MVGLQKPALQTYCFFDRGKSERVAQGVRRVAEECGCLPKEWCYMAEECGYMAEECGYMREEHVLML